jgi:carbon-monoxide dehydrogenase large subunit
VPESEAEPRTAAAADSTTAVPTERSGHGLRAPAPRTRYIGRRFPRPEATTLLHGRGHYVADIDVPGRLDLAFARSPHAHGILTGVRLDAARRLPGVVHAAAAGDLPDLPDVPPSPRSRQPAAMRRPALATDRVRFVGEAIAVVAAEDRYVAADAAELIEIDVEPLPAVLSAAAAVSAYASPLFAAATSGNVSSVREYGSTAEMIDAAFVDAPVIIATTLTNQRVAPVSIEPRGILIRPSHGDTYRIWCSH